MSKPQQPALPQPKQPVVQPVVAVTVAHFTDRELETIRRVCRDSDNEFASRMLGAALARAEQPAAFRKVDEVRK